MLHSAQKADPGIFSGDRLFVLMDSTALDVY